MKTRTLATAAIGWVILAGSAHAQFQLPINNNLASRLRWVQFDIVGGRITASSIHAGANMNSSSNSGGRREKINIDLTGAAPDIHYELVDGPKEVLLDVNDGEEFSIRNLKREGKLTMSIQFEQVPGKELTATLETPTEKRTLTGPTLWHLLLDDPEVTRDLLAPTLELLKPGWRLAAMSEAIEEALCQSARLHRGDDRARWEVWVRQLSSSHYADRQEAERQMLEAGREILPFLRGLDRSSLDAEQWRRIRNVIETLDNAQTDSVEQTVSLLAGDPRAWLLLLNRRDEAKRRLAKEQIESITGKPVDFDPGAAEEVRSRQLEKMRERWVPAPATEEK